MMARGDVQSAHTILLYYSLPDEVPTSGLISALDGKRLVLPRVVGDDLELRLYTGEADLAMSERYHIMEPVGALFDNYVAIDLAIIPGMAFDERGNRLGRGKGYYDRLLSHEAFASIYKLGLCFDFQLVADIPVEGHDLAMDEVVVVPTHYAK